MRRAPSHALFGPAVLLYLLADAAASQGQLDGLGAVLAVLCALLALTPLLCARHAERPGSTRVGMLGLSLAFALLPSVAPSALSLSVEVVPVLAQGAVALLLLELAATLPDAVPRARLLVRLARAAVGAAAVLGLLALAPAGLGLLPSASLSLAPRWACAAAVLLALALRLLRRRFGSSPEALASNAWAALGLLPASARVLGAWPLAFFGYDLGAQGERVALACSAAALLLGQLWSIDPGRRLGAGGALRELAAAVLAAGATAGLVGAAWPFAPSAPLPRSLAAAAALLMGLALQRALSGVVATWLAPARGRLLHALEDAEEDLARSRSLPDLARVALGVARRASGSALAEPTLHVIDPPLEIRIDAAGEPHAAPGAPPRELLSRLQAAPAELLLRAPLEAEHVRKPSVRAVLQWLVERDVFCVLPLVQHGELEGLLSFPRGSRRGSAALEEIEALRQFGQRVVAPLALFAREARLTHRADAGFAEAKALGQELGRTRAEQARLLAEVRELRAGGGARSEGEVVAYGPAMRGLLVQLERSAREGHSVLLWAERGVWVRPLARLLHARGEQAQGPFVEVDCAALGSELAGRALISMDAEHPGLLARATGGTLALYELPALPEDAQQALTAALAARRVRLIASARRAPGELVAAGVLRAELHKAFAREARVPPLRERREDLPSLCLLCLGRAARVLGREPVGIDDEARAVLLEQPFPGNEDELDSLIERAAARARGPRITRAELAELGLTVKGAAGNPLDATLDRVERRALRRALQRAGGSKREAAKLLGIPRTTLLDKLRRHAVPEAAAKKSEVQASEEESPRRS